MQPDRVKSSCSITNAWECERGRANVLSLSRHVPSRARGATHRVALAEPRKRRADERHVVGCCEELGSRRRDSETLGTFDFTKALIKGSEREVTGPPCDF